MTTTNNSKPGKKNSADRAEALSTGTTKHFPNASQTLTIGGEAYTVTQVNGNLGQIVSLRAASNDAKANAKAKVGAEKAQLPPLLLFMAAYVAFVKATFGNAPDVLADFGLVPRKARTPLTAEQKAAAKAKGKATREARGTRGPKAKQAITGNVVGVQVTPITAPAAAPAAPAAPAPQPAQAASAPSGSANGTAGTATGGAATPHS